MYVDVLLFNFLLICFIRHEKNKIIKTNTEELDSIKEKLNSIKVELADIDESKKEKKKTLDKLSK